MKKALVTLVTLLVFVGTGCTSNYIVAKRDLDMAAKKRWTHPRELVRAETMSGDEVGIAVGRLHRSRGEVDDDHVIMAVSDYRKHLMGWGFALTAVAVLGVVLNSIPQDRQWGDEEIGTTAFLGGGGLTLLILAFTLPGPEAPWPPVDSQ